MKKVEAQAILRERIAALPIDDLAMLVKVAGEAINDMSACREIADIVDLSYDHLHQWGERTLYSGDADTALAVVGETAMGWYENVPQG